MFVILGALVAEDVDGFPVSGYADFWVEGLEYEEEAAWERADRLNAIDPEFQYATYSVSGPHSVGEGL